jgi:hypothetical protein
MAESAPYPDSHRNSDLEPDRGSTAGTPRWVKAFGAIALILVLLVGVLLLTGGGNHGPGRHTGSGETGGQALPSRPQESGGHTPPAGGHAP